MAKVIARRVVELGSVICVVAGGPTGAIVASDWLPQKILNLSKKDFHLKNGCNFMGLDKNAPGSHSSKKPLFNQTIKQLFNKNKTSLMQAFLIRLLNGFFSKWMK